MKLLFSYLGLTWACIGLFGTGIAIYHDPRLVSDVDQFSRWCVIVFLFYLFPGLVLYAAFMKRS